MDGSELRLQAEELRKNGKLNDALNLYTEAANQGDIQSQYECGLLYFYGSSDIIARDGIQAVEYMTQAAESGYSKAMLQLARFYKSGIDENVPRNDVLAQQWTVKAAQAGESTAQIQLAHSLLQSVPPEPQEAIIWYEKAAEESNIRAYLKLAEIYEFGQFGIDADTVKSNELKKKAGEIAERLANEGDIEAACLYGCMLRDGIGMERDDKKAYDWLNVAAGANYTEAEYEFGCFLEAGRRNTKEGLKLMKFAARKGHVLAQLRLGLMVMYNRDITVDRELAADMFKRVHEAGNVEGTSNYAYMVQYGLGTEQSFRKAAELYRIAAEAGVSFSQYMLGMGYLEGLGVVKDEEEGMKWIKKAAESEEPLALFQMGIQCLSGRLIERDLEKAEEYFMKAGKDSDYLALLLGYCLRYNPAKNSSNAFRFILTILVLLVIPISLAIYFGIKPRQV